MQMCMCLYLRKGAVSHKCLQIERAIGQPSVSPFMCGLCSWCRRLSSWSRAHAGAAPHERWSEDVEERALANWVKMTLLGRRTRAAWFIKPVAPGSKRQEDIGSNRATHGRLLAASCRVALPRPGPIECDRRRLCIGFRCRRK